MRCFCVRTLCLVAVLISGLEAARAGAFLQAEGDLLILSTSRFTGSAHGFDKAGKLVPLPYYQKYEFSPYIEYGAADWLTLILQPTVTRALAEGPPLAAYNGLTSVEGGARVSLAKFEQTVFSVQATGKIAIARDATNPTLNGSTGNEFDFRLQAGRSFAINDWPGFAEAQLGYRFRSAGPPNEIRADFTAGLRPHARLLLLLQSFNILAPSSGAPGFPAMRQHKLQASLVFDVTKRTALQLGAFTTVAGRNARQEYGLLSALWYRF